MKTDELTAGRDCQQFMQRVAITNTILKGVKSLITNNALFLLLLVTITFLPFPGRAQGTFPRDGNEELAMRLHDWYVESQKKLANLQAELPRAQRNAKQFHMPGDTEDLDKFNQMEADIRTEQERIRKYEAAWVKIRTNPPAPPRSFSGRYGSLSESLKPSSEVGIDQVKAAILNFPFDETAAKNNTKKPVISTQTVTPVTGATFTAEKGAADSWSDIKVTISNLAKFKTSNSQGWRNNGTEFSGNVAGSGPVTITIELTARGGISYYDYKTEVMVKASNVDLLVSDNPVISKDGGTKTYTATWNPSLKVGGVDIRVSIMGGNPEFFTYFVRGWIGGR